MNKSIYQIQNEYQLLIEQIIEADGELTHEQEFALQINKEELQSKGVNYGYVIKGLEDTNQAIENEIKRLNALKKRNSNLIDRLAYNISNAMQMYEIREIKTDTLKLSFRTSESVEVSDISLLDRKFVKTKIEESADKIAIKQAIKSGESVTGAVLITKDNLQIK